MTKRATGPVFVERTDPATHPRKPPADIPGWGADLDRGRRPAVPMERTPPRGVDVAWDAPEAQPQTVRVFHSTERPGLTPLFGTTCPPRGLSGRIRERAFGFSENDIRHWLVLLFADRVDMVEGLLEDLGRGHVPNVLAEMGARAEWKYNRAGFVRKALVASAVAGLLLMILRRRRR